MRHNPSITQAIEIETVRMAKKGLGSDRIASRLTRKYGMSREDAIEYAKEAVKVIKGVFKPDWMKNTVKKSKINPVSQKWIVLYKDGEQVGSVGLTKKNLEELKRQFYLQLIQTDTAGHRHYNVIGIKKEGKKRKSTRSNPPRGERIYDKTISIEAQKGKDSLWPKENFRHNFKKDKTAAEILGLQDGSILIRSTKGKRLWKKFRYPGKRR